MMSDLKRPEHSNGSGCRLQFLNVSPRSIDIEYQDPRRVQCLLNSIQHFISPCPSFFCNWLSFLPFPTQSDRPCHNTYTLSSLNAGKATKAGLDEWLFRTNHSNLACSLIIRLPPAALPRCSLLYIAPTWTTLASEDLIGLAYDTSGTDILNVSLGLNRSQPPNPPSPSSMRRFQTVLRLDLLVWRSLIQNLHP